MGSYYYLLTQVLRATYDLQIRIHQHQNLYLRKLGLNFFIREEKMVAEGERERGPKERERPDHDQLCEGS